MTTSQGSVALDDPRAIMSARPMGAAQWLAVVACILLNALDGFDVLSISFASPGIATEWGVDRAALGVVLSMELIGMAAGSVIIGNLADRIGRRPTILGCLVLMAVGMGLAPLAWDLQSLSAIRMATGLGIGGMLACTNAMVAEFANDRRRHLAVALMAGGYPLGAVLGGAVASMLLANGEWRHVFVFGAICTAACLPLAWVLLPESVGFLTSRRGAGDLDRVNRLLARMGHPTVTALPPAPPKAVKPSLAQLFAPGMARATLLLTFAYSAHIMTFYFILKWIPKIVVDMGYAPSLAGGVLVWANVGGLSGAVLLSLLTTRINLRPLVIGALILSAGFVTLFGQVQDGLGTLALLAAVAGFCTNAGVVGFYALLAQAFPTALRAGGTGFAIGVGRGGAVLGPIIAGLLFAQGLGLGLVAVVMALGSLLAAAALAGLPSKNSAAG